MNMNIPAAIVCETRVNEFEGEAILIKNPRYADTVNLSTGAASVVRMIGGLRYDNWRDDLSTTESDARMREFRVQSIVTNPSLQACA